MEGEPPTGDFLLAYRLRMTVEAVDAMSEPEYLGWQEFFPIHDMWTRLLAKTEAARQ